MGPILVHKMFPRTSSSFSLADQAVKCFVLLSIACWLPAKLRLAMTIILVVPLGLTLEANMKTPVSHLLV